jgi:transposase InsO family protein
MKRIIKHFGIDEKLTKVRLKQKDFNEIKYNVPMIENYNFMADVLHLPQTKKNFKYALILVDLATKEFDIEPMKTTQSEEAVTAMEKMFKRKYIKKPKVSIQTDNGPEFGNNFTKYCYENNIFHKKTMPYRHQQQSMVESLNRQIGRILNGYMNRMEIETGVTYREWDDILVDLRKMLNEHRKIEIPKEGWNYNKHPVADLSIPPRYNIGDIVHYKLSFPRNALDKKQSTANFREGDYRYSHDPYMISQVLIYNTKPYYRYLLNGVKNVSFSEYDLLLASRKKNKEIKAKEIDKKKPDYQKNDNQIVPIITENMQVAKLNKVKSTNQTEPMRRSQRLINKAMDV